MHGFYCRFHPTWSLVLEKALSGSWSCCIQIPPHFSPARVRNPADGLSIPPLQPCMSWTLALSTSSLASDKPVIPEVPEATRKDNAPVERLDPGGGACHLNMLWFDPHTGLFSLGFLHAHCKCQSFSFLFFFNFFWSIVDLQCCVSFCCIAKWISYTYTYIYSFDSSLI